MFEEFGNDDIDIVRTLGPAFLEKQVMDTIQLCWMTLPRENRTIDALEAETRMLYERALSTIRDSMRRRSDN